MLVAAWGVPAAAIASPARTANIACGNVAQLDAAITAANAGTGPSTIALAPRCTYVVTAPYAAGSDALPVITGSVTLTGQLTTIERPSSASALFRIAEVSGTDATLTVKGITATGGDASEWGGCYMVDTGDSELVLQDSVVTGCQAGSAGGAIFVNGNDTSLEPTPNLEVTGSQLTHNTAGVVGGAIEVNTAATVRVTNSTVSHNSASFGGAFDDESLFRVVVSGSTISANQAAGSGSGPWVGGAVFTQGIEGTFTLLSSRVLGNSATQGGGIYNLAVLTLRNTLVSGNTAPGGGGGIANPLGSATTPVTSIISRITANRPDNCEPVGSVPGCSG